MSEEEEGFATVTTAALNVLLLGLETKLDACLGSMMRGNWSAVESVRSGMLTHSPFEAFSCGKLRWCPSA